MGNLFCCVQVHESTVAIKERFGKFDKVLEPGFHCVPWFLGIQLAGRLSLRLQQLDIRFETKTKDNVFVNVVASVQYRVQYNDRKNNKAKEAFYKLSNTRSQIQAHVLDVIRERVPKMNLDNVFKQKNDIANNAENKLRNAMSEYGYEIVKTLIVDIEPDDHVKRAMNENNAAARQRLEAKEKAEAEKFVQIKRAEGEAESKYLLGVGIAKQHQAIANGLKESVNDLKDNVFALSQTMPGTTFKDVLNIISTQ